MLGQQRRARTGPKLAWRRPRIRHRLVRLADPWPPCRCDPAGRRRRPRTRKVVDDCACGRGLRKVPVASAGDGLEKVSVIRQRIFALVRLKRVQRIRWPVATGYVVLG